MKKTVLSFAALALSAGSTLAADLPSRKEPPLPPLPPLPASATWTGFYVGLNAGGAWSASSGVNTISSPIYLHPSLGTGSIDNALYDWALPSALGASGVVRSNTGGFIGGGQIGYNWQATGSFVLGLEADIQGLTSGGGRASSVAMTQVGSVVASSSSGAPIWTTNTATKSLNYLGTVRGRLGYLITPTLLVYGSGGLAYGGVSLSAGHFSIAPTISAGSELANAWGGAGSYSNTQVGWTAGGGVEWMFLPNWSVKAEYLYYNLGAVSLAQSPSGSFINNAIDPRYGQFWWQNASRTTASFNGNIVRAGVNYHFDFGSPAPIAARF